MYQDRPLRRLRSQLVLTFLLSSLGIGIAIGLPVLLLINRQATSQALLLLDQATLTTQAFLTSEQSDLQNLTLLVSQRPTLTRLLEDQDFSSLEAYLNTLRESVDLDLILICTEGHEVEGIGENISMNELCQADATNGYAALSSGDDLYLYAAVNLESIERPVYKVIAGKRISVILRELQTETGLRYFLVQQNQGVVSSDPSIEITPALTSAMLNNANETDNLSSEGSTDVRIHYSPQVWPVLCRRSGCIRSDR